MAKAEEKKPAAEAPKDKGGKARKKGGGKLRFIVLAIFMGIMLMFMMPTFILFLVGMIPTYVTLFTDTDHEKSASSAVGAMNFAGVVPFAIDLWMKGQTIGNVFGILMDPNSWLVMLGAAGIGHMIMFAVPQATATLTIIRAESRLKLLKKNIESLRDSWGPEVGTTKPLDQIGKG